MRKLPLLLITALLLAGGLPFLGPTAAALSWTTANINTSASTGGNPFCINMAASGSNVWVAFGARDTQSIAVARSTDDGHSYAASVVDDTANALYCPSIDNVGTNLVICWTDDSNGDVYFSRSSNAGVLWTVPSNVASSSAYKNCSIAALSSTTYLIVLCDDTASDVLSIRSTNSGATWSSPATVDSTDDCGTVGAGSNRQISLANQDETIAVAVWVTGTGSNAKGCQSTDGGVTWATCYTIQSGSAQAVDLEHVTSSTFDVALLTTTPTVKWCRSTTSGSTNSFGCATAVASPGTSSDVAVATSPVDPDNVEVAWGNGGTSQTAILKGSTSTDGGATWSAAETIRTLTGGTNAQSGAVAAAVNGIGEAIVAQTWCTSSCASTTARLTEASYATLVSAFAAAETTTVTNLVAMTTDPTGRLLVARTDNGGWVRNYNAQSLASGTTGTYETANCASNIRPGIMAQFPNVGFLDCGGDANFDTLRIRNNQMGDPAVPSDQYGSCPTAVGDACAKDFGATGFSGDYGQFANLNEVNTFDQTFGLDYINSADRAPTCSDSRLPGGSPGDCGWQNFLWWSFTTTNGKLGVHTLAAKDGAIGDRRHEYTVQFAPSSSTVNHLCTGSAVGPGTYIVGAHPGTAAQEYRLTFTFGNGDILTTDLTASIQQVWSGSGITYQAEGVACSSDRVLLFNPNTSPQRIYAFRPTDGSFLYSIDLEGSGANRGLTVAKDRKFGAFVDGATMKVFNTTDGTVTRAYALPEGTFKDIRMDAGAQNVWVATSSRLARYVVFEATTITPAPILPETTTCGESFVCTSDDSDDEVAPFGDPEDVLPGDGNAFGGALIITAFTIFGFAAVGFHKMHVFGGVLGGILGFLVSWGFSYLNPAAVFTLVVLAVLAAVFWVKRG